MRRIFIAVLLLLVAVPALALTETEYTRMRRNSAAFARANRRLSQVWTSLRRELPKNVFTELRARQREWLSSGRDEAAERYMDEGYSRVQAYTMATSDRADVLPDIADEIRAQLRRDRAAARNPRTPSRTRPRPAPDPEPEPEPQPEPTPAPEPEPEPEPTPEPPAPAPEPAEAPATPATPANPEGEYRSNAGFMTIKLLDRSAMEVEVTFSRYKDGVHWTATGWIDDGVLELYDSHYSQCTAKITFTGTKAKVEISDSQDWTKAAGEDFNPSGVYTKD